MSDARPLVSPTGRPDAPARWPQPFRIVAPGPGINAQPVVFASPHSGRFYPLDMLSRARVPLINLRRTEDAFVDELFADAPRHGAHLISAVFGRTFVDLNRGREEIDGEMFHDAPPLLTRAPGERVRAGLGCLPRVAAGGEPIYSGKLDWSDGQARIHHVHQGYHDALKRLIFGARSRGAGKAILIDCHSMPSGPRHGRRLPHIVLGDRFGAACSYRLIAAVERAFRSMGYSVARNAPYAGGHTTREYGRPSEGLHALQIEINRSLYLDESAVVRTDRFERVRADMQKIIAAVSDPDLHARL